MQNVVGLETQLTIDEREEITERKQDDQGEIVEDNQTIEKHKGAYIDVKDEHNVTDLIDDVQILNDYEHLNQSA